MDIKSFFEIAIREKASDLHLIAGSLPAIRINGKLEKIGSKFINNEDLSGAIFGFIDESTRKRFDEELDVDFSREFSGCRFRINLHHQEGKIALAARHIPDMIPSPKELRFDEVIYKFTHLQDGLILVTGPTGCGKSTTLAAMINIINNERRSHIITIEDPIEFIFEEKQSIIEQREIGRDAKSFSTALKYVLRQDPNVIMIGEMRDIDTISLALTAAETGHLVLSTLHTSTAAETIERIINVFPSERQEYVAQLIATSLKAVIVQQLLPGIDGGRIVAREIMINNQAIANLIVTKKFNQVDSVIQTSRKEGMITMNRSIESLLEDGLIDRSVAKNRMRDPGTKSAYY